MANSKEIKIQIASIGNTQKITSAMEKVAVSKMKKTQDKMLKGRPYRDRMLSVISHLAKGQPEYKPKYMEERDVKNIAIIVISSDKGLCGGLNANLLREVTRFASQKASEGKNISYSLIGTKAQSFFKSFGGNVISATEKLGDDPSIEQLVGSMKILLDSFSEGEIDKVYLASNSFVNTMTQDPEINQLLPLSKIEDEEEEQSKETPRWDYIYEPDDSRVLLDGLMERYIESLLYQSVIENIACEQAAKMVAMKSATDNAGSLIEELQLVYNNARQALGKEAGKAEIPWEVRPSAHYSMGGIRVDEHTRVIHSAENQYEPIIIKGLFAAGQAMGGLFGANRLGSTSLTELAVFGYRAGKSAAKNANQSFKNKNYDIFHEHYFNFKNVFNKKGKLKPYKLKLDLQKKCWDNIGPARTEKKLKKMLTYLDKIEKDLNNVNVPNEMIWNQQFIDLIELKNMITTAKAVAIASLKREKSVGGHVRLDKKTSSLFSKPYSTLVKINKNNTFEVCKLLRQKTPLKRIINYKISEKFRFMKAKILRILPESISDKIIENKYKNILGTDQIIIKPGSLDGAPGDKVNQI